MPSCPRSKSVNEELASGKASGVSSAAIPSDQRASAMSKRMSWLSSKVRRGSSAAPTPRFAPSTAPPVPSQPRSAGEFTLDPDFTTQLEAMSPVSRSDRVLGTRRTSEPHGQCAKYHNELPQRHGSARPSSGSASDRVTLPSSMAGSAHRPTPSKSSHGRDTSSRGRGSSSGGYSSKLSSSPHRSSLQSYSVDCSSRISSPCSSSPRILVQEKIVDPASLLAGRFSVETPVSPHAGGKLVALPHSQSDLATKIAPLGLLSCKSQDSLLRISASDANCLQLSFDGPLPAAIKSEGLTPAPPRRNSRAATCRCSHGSLASSQSQHEKGCPARSRRRARTLSQVPEKSQPPTTACSSGSSDAPPPPMTPPLPDDCSFGPPLSSTSHCLTPTFGAVEWAAIAINTRASHGRPRGSSLPFKAVSVSPKTKVVERFDEPDFIESTPVTAAALREHERLLSPPSHNNQSRKAGPEQTTQGSRGVMAKDTSWEAPTAARERRSERGLGIDSR
ncbi:unnamed protein product [Parajaminaea phylloscopi]